VAEAFAEMVDSHCIGALNIGSGDPITLSDFVRKLAERSGHPDAVDFGALPTPAYEPPRVVADMTRSRRVLRWRPQLSLDEGIDESVRWWRDRWAGTSVD
jgi:nucleoside-diphosphate-sugar epimerase